MHVKNVIRLHYDANWSGYKPVSGTPHHLLMFVESGHCVYKIDGIRHIVKKGEALFIAEQLEREAEAIEEAHTKYSIHWTGDSLYKHFPQLKNQAVVFQTASLYPYLKQTYTRLHRIWTEKDLYYNALCEAMLLEIAVRVHQEHSTFHGARRQDRMVQQVRDYILEYYREPLSIEELAHLVGRNPSHLITSFKKHYGMPPIEFMHKTRITKAEELLLTSNVSIEALAGMLGYCDASHFSRMFRRLTGITASAYRKRLWK